ncbi:hypothetical protein IJ182_10555 [bacterium]|nr:hypothetical protein [bacterium]
MRIPLISSYNSIFNSNVSFYGKSSGYAEKRYNYQQKSPFQKAGSKFSASFGSGFDDIEKRREEIRRKAQEMQQQIERIRTEQEKRQEQYIKQYQRVLEKARAKQRDKIRQEQEKIRQEQDRIRQEQDRIRQEQDRIRQKQERQWKQWRQFGKTHTQSQWQYDCSEECQKDLEQFFKPMENLKVGEKVSPEIKAEMKKQYRQLKKIYHPDLHSGSDKDFKEIQNQCQKRGLVDSKGRWIE